MHDRPRFTLATNPEGSAWTDYLEDTLMRGVPATYLIGRDGRLEWFGHPKDLEPPLQNMEPLPIATR